MTARPAQRPRPTKPAKPSRRRRPDKPVQLSLCYSRRGGWRFGAGRPRKPDRRNPHTRRPALASRFPVHVTLSVDEALPNLRSPELRTAIEGALREARGRFDDFRVVHYSIQRHHLHLIVEAHHARALSRGMQGLCIRLARAINRAAGRRRGRVFVDRYFERILRTPRQVRNCLVYVLGNARKHAAQRRKTFGRDWTDPCSSAAYFEGWNRPLQPPAGPGPPTAAPRTWLLEVGWRRHGLIAFDEAPA